MHNLAHSLGCFRAPRSTSFLENVHKTLIAAADLLDDSFPRHLLVAERHKGVPECRAANRKTNEPRNRRGCCQLLADFLVILTTAQNNAANIISAVTASSGNDFFAIFPAIKPFNLPDIRFHPGVL